MQAVSYAERRGEEAAGDSQEAQGRDVAGAEGRRAETRRPGLG